MTILRLTNKEYRREIRKYMIQLFGTEKPRPPNGSFNHRAEEALILYEYWGLPDSETLRAIVSSAVSLGEDGVYLTLGAWANRYPDREYHWYVPFEDVEKITEIPLASILKYVFVSPHGTWGIAPAKDSYAVLVGPIRFVERVAVRAPRALDGVKNLLVDLKLSKRDHAQHDISWAPIFLESLFGKKRTESYLRSVNW